MNMNAINRSALIVILLTINSLYSASQIPINQRNWQSVATKMPEEWYGSEESVRVAENVLLYQRDIGGVAGQCSGLLERGIILISLSMTMP